MVMLQSLTRVSLRVFAALLGLGLLGYLVLRAGPEAIWKQVQAVGWGLALIIILGGFSQLLRTCAWRQTFMCDIRRLSWSRSLGVQLASDAAGQLGLAGKLIGEGIRISLLRSIVPLASGISACAIDGGPRSLDNDEVWWLGSWRRGCQSPWIGMKAATAREHLCSGIRTCKVRNSLTMAGMRRMQKPSPTESPLLFEVDPKPLEETLTALGGIPLVVQAFRSLGLPGSVQQHVAVKERERGYDEATFVESFVILNAAGGECVDDFAHLRSDAGLAELVGHELPSPEVARKFLNAFHEEEKIQEAQQRRLPDAIAYIPEENRALEGLGQVNRDLIQRLERIRRSSRWIKTPRLSRAANERPCIPTKGRAATNRCWRYGQRWMWCWRTNFATGMCRRRWLR